MRTKLARYMADHGITQVEAERRSGVNRRTIATAQDGSREPSLDTWAKLARGLGCNVYDISEDAYSRLVGSV